MSDADKLLTRLRTEEERLVSLVRLLVDDLLGRPVTEMVEPAWLAARVVEGLQSTASNESTRGWIKGQVRKAMERAEQETGSLGGRLPDSFSDPVKGLLSRPYQPREEVMRALLDHEGMHILIREVLVSAITDFGSGLKFSGSEKKRFSGKRGAFSQIMEAASEVASTVGAQVEGMAEGRIQAFVDSAISRSLEISIQRICADSFVEPLSRWRTDAVNQLLDIPLEGWRREIQALDPAGLVDEILDVVAGISAVEGLPDLLEGAMSAAMEEAGDSTLRDFLQGSSLEEDWRGQVETILVERARDFVQTKAFETWLTDLLA